jgi:tRNA dimethylallyltransferase
VTKLIVICGATATGKSSLALVLAQRLDSIILSADSRQVYCEFDIGTAKPSITAQKLVPHYLIDISPPIETITVASYQAQAQSLIATTSPPALFFLVGGTGLYIRAIVQGMKIPPVAPHPELRSQLASLGQTQLYPMLQQVDPVSAQKIHPHDSFRTLRALEVYYVTGMPISQQQGENPPTYPILQVGLDCQGEKLRDRIDCRTEQMIADGLVAEVASMSQKYGAGLPLLNTLGYQEIKQYLAGEISLESAKELIKLHTRQFAKRQRTWFRAIPQIEWFDADSPDLSTQVWQRIIEFIHE